MTFEDALNDIVANAFNISGAPNPADPIFLHLRIKSTNQSMMNVIANCLKVYDTPYLLGSEYSYEYQKCLVVDSSQNCMPNNLSQLPLYIFQGKIIVMVDRSNSSILDNEKLMECVNITTSSIHSRLLTNHNMRFSPDQTELVDFNKRSMSIVTPDVGVSTTNPNPGAAALLGVQVAAINFSNADENMKNTVSLFTTAGRAFILKPANLRYVPLTITIPADNPASYNFKAREFQGRGWGPYNI